MMTNSDLDDPLETLKLEIRRAGWNGSVEYATAFQAPRLAAVLALWHEKAKGGVPARAALEARELAEALPNLSVIETVSDGERVRYRMRRMGTEIARFLGDMTGRFLDEVLPASSLPRWEFAARTFIACNRPVRVDCTVDLPQASFLRAEALHAPLLDANGAQTIFMAVTYFSRSS